MKNFKTLLALLLALVMVFALAACGAKDDAKEPADDKPATDKPADDKPADEGNDGEESFGNYVIGYNCLGSGVWILDTHQALNTYYIESIGSSVNAASANFSSDQMLKDIQNQINAGEDGHMYFGAFGTLTHAVSDLFEDAGVYWVNWDQQISTDIIDEIRENPYFVGSVGSQQDKIAYVLAEAAYEAGCRKALQMAGAVGDVAHDARMAGFQERFEELGGETISIARCTDPSEAAAKGDDIVAAYGAEADCFYALNMDFALGAYQAIEKYGFEDSILVISSELDAWGVEMVKNGKMIGDTYVAHDGAWGSALLINALDGHPILDENGEAPYSNALMTWMITEDRADFYQEHYVEGYPVTDADYQSMLYRYNPDVTWDYMNDKLASFDYDSNYASWNA